MKRQLRNVGNPEVFLRIKVFICWILLAIFVCFQNDISAGPSDIGTYYFLGEQLSNKSGGTLDKGKLVQVTGYSNTDVELRLFEQKDDKWEEVLGSEKCPQKFNLRAWTGLQKIQPRQESKNGQLYFKRRNGNSYPVYILKINSPVCQPNSTVLNLADQTKNILNAARRNRLSENLAWVESLNLSRHFSNYPELYRSMSEELRQLGSKGSRSLLRTKQRKLSELEKKAGDGLARAKREFVQKLEKRVEAKLMTESEAVDVVIALTLFGEFRGGRQKAYDFFPRSPAHLFWMTKVLEERSVSKDPDGSPRFNNHRLSIYLPSVGKKSEEISSFLQRTAAGAAMAQLQWSCWNTSASNFNLASMLDPDREGSSGRTAMKAIAHFLDKYRANHYEILGNHPHIDHYDSPTAYYSVGHLSEKISSVRDRDKQRQILWGELKNHVSFVGMSIPTIRDKSLNLEYDVDPRVFIGGR